MTEQLFDDEITLDAIPYFTWENVGDKVTGVYVGKVFNTTPDKYDKIKEEYVLKQKNGTYIKVGGRALPRDGKDGETLRVIFGMENVKFGEILGFKFTEDRDTGKGNLTKIIEVIYPLERIQDLEAVKEYEALYGASEASAPADLTDEIDVEEMDL